MLHITGSMKTLKKELVSAKNFCKDVIGVLETVDANTNLTYTVGHFAVRMPEYKVLVRDADTAKRILRMVCTGEMNPLNAAKEFRSGLSQVEDLLNLLQPLN